MLFKRDTDTARDAKLPLADVARMEQVANRSVGSSAAMPQPSPERLELDRLAEENIALRRDLANLREQWGSALAAAETKAREAAAQAHVADDTKRFNELRDALLSARKDFEGTLLRQTLPAAKALASDALSRLVSPQVSEQELLARAIHRRLNDLQSNAVVALHLPGGIEPSLVTTLNAELPVGAIVLVDQSMAPGTARLALRLGLVEIDLSRGLSDVLAIMGDGADGA